MHLYNKENYFGFRVARYALALENCSGAFDRNTLSCDCIYTKGPQPWGWMSDIFCWEEFLQTDDIIRLYDGFVDVWKKRADTYDFTDIGNHLRMTLTRDSEESYELQITAFGKDHGNDIVDTFILSQREMDKFLDELFYWKKKFPVVD